METANRKVEHAKAHLSHLGYGTGTNFTVQNVAVLMVSYANHQSTSQQQTIERLRDLVKRMYESMAEMQKDGLELYDEDMDLIEEAKQLLNTTEPIDQ